MFDSFILIIELLMLLLALGIATVKTVRQMIRLYQFQCYLLAAIALLTIYASKIQPAWLFVIVLIPIFLAAFIEILLAHATVSGGETGSSVTRSLFYPKAWPQTREQAARIWLQDRPEVRGGAWIIFVNFLLIGGAFVIAGVLQAGAANEASRMQLNSLSKSGYLAVSLSLLLLGIAVMINKEDIISQIIGLLVSEHGMFLVAIRAITTASDRLANLYPTVLAFFVISLFAYTLITLILLIVLLPNLHRTSGHIEVDSQKELRG